MASPARILPRRLGQLSARTRLSTPNVAVFSAAPATLRRNPWICHGCASRALSTSRRLYSSEGSVPVTNGDVNSLPSSSNAYEPLDTFPRRHIGPKDVDTVAMLQALSPPVKSLDDFVRQVIPPDVLSKPELITNKSGEAQKSFTESELARKFGTLAKGEGRGQPNSFIGAGYYGTHVPSVIQRNVLENPAWYTSYTPYQPEISQGRLESLLNFQTMVSDLTGLPVSNASLLDEGTAAAEAMTMSMNSLSTSRAKREGRTFIVSDKLHPQTISVLRGRADGFGIHIKVMDVTSDAAKSEIATLGDDLVGVMVQYPDTYGGVEDFKGLAALVHEKKALLSCATDLLALTMMKAPGEWGADIAFGNAQRFGVPVGFGGPHAAFFAVAEKHQRKMPGRLVGVSKDRLGAKAYRLALQTREQHIRREKATSNVCTAQALLANMSALYGVYHGPDGVKAIAERVVRGARIVQSVLQAQGFQTTTSQPVPFDTVVVDLGSQDECKELQKHAAKYNLEFRFIKGNKVGISIDETTTFQHLRLIALSFSDLKSHKEPAAATGVNALFRAAVEQHAGSITLPDWANRTSAFMTHPVFNMYHSETELLRYIYHLQSKDLSLVHSMTPLGSCTMKLNGTTEMSLITDKRFSTVHPYSSGAGVGRYHTILARLQDQLASITGMDAVSLQPNSGAQGEFSGLRTILEYHESRATEGAKKRDICLIPKSAHGTNPASAAMAGMRVVSIECDKKTGNLDIADLEAKCKKYQDELAAIMVTYPSTFGVFEPEIRKVCSLVHEHGGQVYMDGANMNAQIGLCSPGDIGADVCHLNLHKTFCIPHGGGGPGVGPICVKSHLAKYLPASPQLHLDPRENPKGPFPVSSAHFGSASIDLISWAYITMMGPKGLTHATKMALLNANYLMSRLEPHYNIVYTNEHGRCAHEFILDVRPFLKSANINEVDIAKRLQDYGFHAPTMSWPVHGTLMIEPTESESKEELDRFVDALVSIREEIREIEEGKQPREGNVLKMAPHPMQDLIDGEWDRTYTRDKAAYPLPCLREKKFWPTVARVDDVYGDTHLFCTCPPVEDTV